MTSIPLPYDINTTEVRLVNQKLRDIPEWIQLLPLLEELNLDMNRISTVPEWLGNMTNLKSLDLSNNKISILPSSLGNLINLESIRLHENHFRYFPECISSMTNLKNIGISNNMIEIIPESIFNNCVKLDSFSICNNYLTAIPSNIENLTNLIQLLFLHNDIITLPISITRLTNLDIFYYKHNPYMYLPPQVMRFMYRHKNKRLEDLHVYGDSQSVHTSSIQRSISQSIENIMNQPFKLNIEETMYEIMNDPLINCWNDLSEYSLGEEVHSTLHITFKELLCCVWGIIKTLENQHEIKNILNQEMHCARNKCFTGKISRLINCLNGFTPLVSITIDDSQEIGNIITIARHKLGKKYTVEEHKEIVKNEMIERGYTPDTVVEWLEYIE
jgi:hypothetical protein